MKVTQDQIQAFLSAKTMAFAGVSRETKKFGRMAYEELKKSGYRLYPVNPNIEELDGQECYGTVSEVPDDSLTHLFVITPKAQTAGVVEDAIEKGISNIWIQQGADTPEVLKIAKDNNINVVHGECIFMHLEPVKGVHAFHRFLRRVFAKMPA